jgi:transposase
LIGKWSLLVMDIERPDSDSEVFREDDHTLDRRIIPAAPRTTIIGRMSPRRRWSVDEKLAIVEASYDPGSSVQEVAHCFEVSPARIYSWRKQAAHGTLDPPPRVAPSFTRVEVADQARLESPGPPGCGTMEIRLADGTAILVGSDVSEETLRRVPAVPREQSCVA